MKNIKHIWFQFSVKVPTLCPPLSPGGDVVSCPSAMSALSEVIIEVQQDSRGKLVRVQSELLELLVLVKDVVVAECAAHIQDNSVVFPGVAAGMSVVAQVTLQDLWQCLLRTHLKGAGKHLETSHSNISLLFKHTTSCRDHYFKGEFDSGFLCH